MSNNLAERYFNVSLVILVAAAIATFLGIYMFNIPDAYWSKVGAFYSQSAILALILLIIALLMQTIQVDTSVGKQLYHIPLGLSFGFLFGLGGLNFFGINASASVASAEDVIKTLLVAFTEEFLYRLALPLFIISFLRYYDPTNRDEETISLRTIIFAIVISNLMFAFFHLIAYGNNLDFIDDALIAGIVQSFVLLAFTPLFGTSVFFGLVGGHFAWNLSSISSNWLNTSIFYLVAVGVLLVMLYLRGFGGSLDD